MSKQSNKAYFTRDHEKVIDFIFQTVKSQLSFYRVLIHFTSDKFTAWDILNEGFDYSESYQKSAVEISGDLVDLRYKYNLYKAYGDYVIIICIPSYLFNNIPHNDATAIMHDDLYNLGLSEYLPGNDLEYRLDKTFIYGFIDLGTLAFDFNELFGK